MGRRFTGWPEQAYDVFLQLDGEPSAETRERLRKDRTDLVKEPMIALCQDLADADPAFDDFFLWHFHTDPWAWQHQCAVFRLARCVELSLLFDLDGLGVKAGWHYPDPGQVDRFRLAVAADDSGAELVEITESLAKQGFELSGDVMKRSPRGYSPDHPRAQLLRHRSLLAARHLGCDDWLHTPQVFDRVRETYDQLRPLTTWLTAAVRS